MSNRMHGCEEGDIESVQDGTDKCRQSDIYFGGRVSSKERSLNLGHLYRTCLFNIFSMKLC